MAFDIGELVWVRTGQGGHEEVATVVKANCCDDSESQGESKDGSGSGKGEADAICVKLNVSQYRITTTPDRIRSMDVGGNNEKGRPRRSRRSASSVGSNIVYSRRSGGETLQADKSESESAAAVVTPPPAESCSTKQSDVTHSDDSLHDEKVNGKNMKGKVKTKRNAKREITPKSTPQRARKKPRTTGKEAPEVTESPHFAATKKSTAGSGGKGTKGSRPRKGSNVKRRIDTKGHKKVPAKTSVKSGTAAASNASDPVAGKPDGGGGLDQPGFTVEYSKTGRATCRRCDKRIEKGQIRIGHTPLFRGKPGFKVYRHLHCAVFSEDVVCAEDVDGYSDLEPDDHPKLAARVEESKEEIKREMEELEPDELVQVSFQGEIRSSPPGLTANLLPFQVEGVSWMYHQEVKETTTRGGILADEMGMGKTLQTIVTILDNRSKLQHAKPGTKFPPGADVEALGVEEKIWDLTLRDWKHEMAMNNVPKSILPRASKGKSGAGARAGTLVICPVIALTQWRKEIERFCEAGCLSVGTYHGPNRETDTPREMLRKYDVVLTTYQVIEADFRKMTSPNKVKCPNCGGKYKIDKLRVHLKYFCGEGAERTEAQARTRRREDGSAGLSESEGEDSQGGNGSKGNKNRKNNAAAKRKEQSKNSSKKAVRVKSLSKFDSESDLSTAEETLKSSPRGRSSRNAAKRASKQMASSAKNWMSDEDSNGSDYSNESAPSSDSDSDVSFSASSHARKTKVTKKAKTSKPRTAKPPASGKNSSNTCDLSEDESPAQRRAREKQEKALELAQSKKRGSKGKKGRKGASAKKSPKRSGGGKDSKKKSFGKKKSKPGKGNDEFLLSDSSDSGEDEPDIDMEKLMKEAMAGSKMSVLHSLSWWRIVLDEAHFIKSRNSQTANATFALIGAHRWCLSGTPLQNRVGEFYSLIRFLRLDPMAHYFCRAKDCGCKSIHYRMMNGRCQDCGHGSIQHFSHFNKYVLNPIQRDGYSGDGRRAMFTLKNEVLDKCLIRRTKETKADDMNLPPRFVDIRAVRLHPVEEDFYNALYTQTRSSFDDYVTDGTLLNNYAHIFDLLMRMRQSVDHPYLVVYSKKDSVSGGAGQALVANGTTDCDICHEPPTDRVVSSCCEAAFCRSCALEYMTSLTGANTPCPSCRSPFSIDLNQARSDVVDDNTLSISRGESASSASTIGMPSLKELPHVATGSILRRINLTEFATSTKIEALTQELVKMRQSSPGSKAIVFSQFVNMLDLIRWRLHSDPCLADMGLGVRALHGGMNVKARDVCLKDFREDNNVRVLIMSLKAGGVALNLTVANHIFLMDPWWNPAAEMQAIDRTHRLGR
mmetsp:Transcript_21216/g.61748  ORF Transcript_21216/g.61748 Transcript_21216/m.61748 type:complete len:1336 (-) Transcript_21216:330-4337(-)